MPSFARNSSSVSSLSQVYYGTTDYSYERDYWDVDLQAGQSLQVTARRNGSPDTYIYGIYTPSGSLVSGTTNDDNAGNLEARSNVYASETGTYRVAVGAFGSNTGGYRLETVIGAAPASFSSLATSYQSYGGSAASATSITLASGSSPTTQYGYIADGEQDGSRDNFSFAVVAGRSYTIRMQGSPSGNGTLRDAYIRGAYLNGSFVGSNDDADGSLDSRVTFYASQTGTLRVAAGAYGSNTGSYRLSVEADQVASNFVSYASTFSRSYTSYTSSSYTSLYNSFSSYSSYSSNTFVSSQVTTTLSSMSLNFSSSFSYSSYARIATTSAFTSNFSSVLQNSQFSSSRHYSAVNWSRVDYSTLSERDFSTRLNFSRLATSDVAEMFRASSARSINWGAALSNSSFASMNVSRYSSFNWSSVFSSSSFAEASSTAYSNINWGAAFASRSFSSFSASSYSNINWGNVQWNEVTSASAYRAINWNSVEYSEFTSSSYINVNWGRVQFNELQTSNYSNVNWGSVQFSEVRSASSYSHINWGSVNYSQMSASSYSSINWSRVQFNEMGRSNLSSITASSFSSSTVTARHITSTSYNAATSRTRDLVTCAANLGQVEVTGVNSSRVGDIYGINTGTMLNITNFNRGVDFLNLGSLNASLLTTAVVGSNTCVYYSGERVATLVGLSAGATVAQLFG